MQRFSLSAVRIRGEMSAPLAFAIGMMAGAAGYVSSPAEPPIVVLLWAAIAVCLLFIWARRVAIPAVLISMLMIGSGMISGVAAGMFAVERSHHVAITQPTGPVLLEGWVRAVQPARSGARLVVDVHAIDGLDARETPDLVRLTHILSLNTEPGRFVRCWAVLRPPPQPVIDGDYDFARQAWFSGLGAVGYVQGRCRGGGLGPPNDLVDRTALAIGTWRRRLSRHVQAAAGERAGGFAAALASGDRSFIRPEDQDALRQSGLAHLLAISGLHMGIVGGLVFLFLWRVCALIEPLALRWPVKKPAAIGALLACSAYLLISGAGLSTQRAFIMSAVAFTAVIFDRSAVSMRSLSIAMIIIIAMAPWSVLTPGFQMSFAATGGLVATYEAWRRRRRRARQTPPNRVVFWLKSLIVTSTVSGFATAPFALFHFERVAGLGLLANFAAMPIISLLSAPLAGAALLLAPFGGDEIALRLFGLSLEAVLWVAHTFSDLDRPEWTALPKMPSSSLACFALAILAYATLHSAAGKTIGVLSCAALALTLWAASATDRLHWAPSGEVFLEYANGRVERWQILDGDGLAPLRFSETPVTASCETRSLCQHMFGDTRLEIHSNTPAISGDLTLTVRRANGAEPHLLTWYDVVRENGITLKRRKERFIRREKPTCGQRPWRPCPRE